MRVCIIAGSGPASSHYAQSLVRRGHDVACGASSAAIARLLADAPCSLAIIDFETPDLDASGAVARIRGSAEWAECLIVGIGASRASIIATMMGVGVDDVIFEMVDDGAIDARLTLLERRIAERAAHLLADRDARVADTERVTAQDALAEERHLLQEILDGTPDLFYVKDTDQRFVRANTAVAAYLGVDSAAELIGRTDVEFYPADQATIWAADERRVIETGESLVNSAEPRFLDRDDTPHVITTKVRLHDRAGQVIGIVGMARDVSDRVAAESAFREGEDRLRLALRAAHMATWEWDVDADRILWTSDEPIFAGGSPEQQPDSWDAVMRSIHPDDRTRIAQSTHAHLNEGANFDVELRVVTADGATRWMACKGEASAHDAEGRSLHLHGVSFDITARKSVENEVAEAHELLEALMEHVPDALYIKDTESRFRRANQTTAIHLNVADRRDLLGKSDFDFFPESLARQFYEEEQTVLRSGVAVRNKLEAQSVDAESGAWFLTSIVPLHDAQGRSVGLLGSARDVSEERRQEIRLRQAESRFRALVEQIPAITYVERIGGGIGRHDYVSPQIKRILGYEPAEWILLRDTQPELILHPDDREGLTAVSDHANATGEAVAVEYRHRHKDGRWVWIRDLAVRLPSQPGEPALWQGVMFDVSEHKTMKDQLEHLAFHDVLTGLPNRALFTQRLQHAVARTGRMHSYVALLFIDVDNFKSVNDSMGHEAGDELLIAVSRRLSGLTRPGDTVARLGGDEFTILLEDLTGHHHAMAVAERVLETFRRPFEICNQMVFATPSIGVALSDGLEPQPLDVLRDADMAMYDAKRAGKGRVRLFDPNDTGRLMPQGILEKELRLAFEHGEFELFYQPIVDVATGSVKWLEALVRWRHPERGVILPGAFIPFAEESGLILEIGAWVIREACRQAMEWQESDPDMAPVAISVNFSSRQFQHPDLVREVASALAESGMEPTRLHLEITESLFLDDLDAAIVMLKNLRTLGVNLALDDFGVGYSSLSYLKQLPVDTVKIDKSFIQGLGQNSKDTIILEAIVALGRNLGMDVVGEGVENAAQRDQLLSLGFTLAQGYLFARPMPAAEALTLLRESRLRDGEPMQRALAASKTQEPSLRRRRALGG